MLSLSKSLKLQTCLASNLFFFWFLELLIEADCNERLLINTTAGFDLKNVLSKLKARFVRMS